MKPIVLVLILFSLFSCANTPEQSTRLNRSISSYTLFNECVGGLKTLLSDNEALGRHRVLHENLRSQPASQAYGQELEYQLSQGSAFLENGRFIFESNMIQQKDVSGRIHVAAYRVSHGGKNLFIKQQSKYMTEQELVEDILNAKIIHELGMGPKTQLVKVDNAYYLVMEDIPGINIKEVLYPGLETRMTKDKIDEMLGVETEDLGHAIQLFARKLLRSDDFIERLAQMESTLKNNGFYDVNDLQFMIDLKKGPDSLQIIDVESFRRSDDEIFSANSPREMFSGIIDLLSRLAR